MRAWVLALKKTALDTDGSDGYVYAVAVSAVVNPLCAAYLSANTTVQLILVARNRTPISTGTSLLWWAGYLGMWGGYLDILM